MLTVQKIDLDLAACGKLTATHPVGKFSTMREVKDHAWHECLQCRKGSLYLCFECNRRRDSLVALIYVIQQNGCIKLKEELVDPEVESVVMKMITQDYLAPHVAEGRRQDMVA